ncbi:hypothetical protein DTO164E3_5784 [Paecilomyces variotii]|nr:hypothetical protein DTO164E3_5784 [Paecilomyces variotii]KAJ9223855.1 hypothetical protein DTO169C6_3725 [Paecilomyces variotii]KAJ9263705.1 hypothetical protein DTO212C5_7490 [Paecilomyces variotii]KAJ9286447.1 hypothetical protein DTO021C3_5981 [Paecilomyces variotii]KAJ9326675.1 hypothetical protein DTO027B3_2336 [Paecilomyces variotii]
MPTNSFPPLFIDGLGEISPTSISYPSDPDVDVPEPYPKHPYADQHSRTWTQVSSNSNPLLPEWAALKPQVTEKVRAAGLIPVVYDIRVAWDRIWHKTVAKDAAQLIIFVEGLPMQNEGELYRKTLEAMKDIHELCGVGFVVLQQCPRGRDPNGQLPEWVREMGEKIGYA